MALEHRLEVKLLQKLILTPQLQQAIKLLQMPQLELSQNLSNELMENPFLEETVDEPESYQNETEKEQAMETDPLETPELAEVPLEGLMSYSVDDYFEERGFDGRDLGYFNPGQVEIPTFEQFTSRAESLSEHLLWQLRLSEIPEKLKNTVELAIGNLDENGYLRITDQELSALAGVSQDEAVSAVGHLREFDPLGVGARNVRECLILQLNPLELDQDSLVYTLISGHLEDIGRKRYQQLSRELGVTMEEVLAAVKVIEGLDPKPCRNFSGSSTVYVAPDVYIFNTDGKYHIVLNEEGLPRLRVSSYYRKLLSRKNTLGKDEKAFLEEKLRAAVWLLKSLDQRNRTIYRITEILLDFQRDFFNAGAGALKPLNLKDIATELGLHESTVSRATSNKYLSCAHGIFPFRFFFSSAVQSGNGSVSSTAVKELIKKLIDEEPPKKPLSDQKVVNLLKEQNIQIARRTVAKYREELNIAPVSQRKSYG